MDPHLHDRAVTRSLIREIEILPLEKFCNYMNVIPICVKVLSEYKIKFNLKYWNVIIFSKK